MKRVAVFVVVGLILVLGIISYINYDQSGKISTVLTGIQEADQNTEQLISTENKVYYTKDIERIVKRGKLIVGLYCDDMPPFFMTKADKTLWGLDIDIAKGIASELGVEAEFDRSSKSFNEMYERLAKGDFDLVASDFSKTFDRSKGVKFSKPYAKLRIGVTVNKLKVDQNDVEANPMDFIRNTVLKIGVMGQTSHDSYVCGEFKNAIIRRYGDATTLAKAVKTGEIFAAVNDEVALALEQARDPELGLYTTTYVLTDEPDDICVAVPNDSEQLLQCVNTYLDLKKCNFTLSDIMKKYPEVFKNRY